MAALVKENRVFKENVFGNKSAQNEEIEGGERRKGG